MRHIERFSNFNANKAEYEIERLTSFRVMAGFGEDFSCDFGFCAHLSPAMAGIHQENPLLALEFNCLGLWVGNKGLILSTIH
ncbi:hypothetical protein MUK42_37603 [Musa troglodytarum]|uniref:Uncharacterized protein n=1 Tax=Musa troglodytarum TaxID=320322 RepID=A0A9E7G114_9LILI|nr:hypothetical protein MUK42_37603 [Musa troglodytarum]